MSLDELARDPSPESWRLICGGLAALPETDAMAAIARLAGALDAWPEELRATICNLDWDDKLLDGNADPRSTILRYFRYDRLFIGRYGGIMIRSRTLTGNAIRGLCTGPGTEQLTRINLASHPLGRIGAEALARATRFANLRELVLRGCDLDEASLRALARAPFYAQLTKLDIGGNKLTDVSPLFLPARSPTELLLGGNPLATDGAATLARLVRTTTTRLTLDDCQLGSDGAAALCGIGHALERLSVSSNALGDRGLASLAFDKLVVRELAVCRDRIAARGVAGLLAGNWPLVALDLSDNALDDEAAALLASRGPRTLEKLVLADNDITAVGLAAIIGSDALAGLTHLDLSTNRIGAVTDLAPTMRGLVSLCLDHARIGDGIRALAKVEADSLRELHLVGNALGPGALQDLTAAPWFGGLTTLDLADNPLGPGAGVLVGTRLLDKLVLSRTQLGDDGLAALCTIELAPRTLALDACDLTDAAVELLAASPIAARIETLRLAGNRITDRGALALAGSPTLRRLKSIFLDNNQLGDDGVCALAAWTGPVQIVVDGNVHGSKGEGAIKALPRRCCP